MNAGERPTIGDERAILEAVLDRARDALTATVSDLSEVEARRQLVTSVTTPIGLIKHAAAVERYWFQYFWVGQGDARCGGIVASGDASFVVTVSETLVDVIAEFRRAVRYSRAIAADYDLDRVRLHPRHGPTHLRNVYLHMIAEHSRHAGHADILCEQIAASRSAPR